jgi:hypothetical protein
VSVFSKTLLPFVSGDLMSFSFLTARHINNFKFLLGHAKRHPLLKYFKQETL